jgi:hypothetical protein
MIEFRSGSKFGADPIGGQVESPDASNLRIKTNFPAKSRVFARRIKKVKSFISFFHKKTRIFFF